MKRFAVALSFVSWVPFALAASGDGGPAEGEFLYRMYCMNCHGEKGRGDGPMTAVLRVRPRDLTRLSKKNGGTFPRKEVWRTIDGRQEVLAHGAREMPIWGLEFQQADRDTNQEKEVRRRIRELVTFLESIQRK